MADIPKETQPPPDASEPKPSHERVKNIPAIQGDDALLAHVEERRAGQEEELAEDLKQFGNRPRPPWTLEDPLHSETVAQIERARSTAEKHHLPADLYAREELDKLDPRWKQALTYLREREVRPYTQLEILNDFSGSEPPVPDSRGLIVNRYYEGVAQARGNWVTDETYPNVIERRGRLSLPPANSGIRDKQYFIPNGTVYLRGRAASKFGYEGEGSQIYVFDPSVLQEVDPS